MKQMKFFGVAILILALIILAACGQKGVTSQPTSNPPSQATASIETPVSGATLAATAAVDGNALILEKLQNHHSIDRVYGATHTREEWNTTLDRMIGYGAKISEEEKKVIIDYLLSRK